jgi:hypothetical protein
MTILFGDFYAKVGWEEILKNNWEWKFSQNQ